MHKIIAALVALLLLTSCQKQPKRYEAEFLLLFDTMTRIVGYADSEQEFTAQATFIKESLQEYHELFDIYKTYDGIANLKTINDNAGIAPVAVDARIIELLEFCKEMYAATDGKVNAAMGSVLSLWHEYREAGIADPLNAQLPPTEKLQVAAEHIDINDIIIDKSASTVYLSDSQMSLDVGAIAKGYAAQRVCELARAQGIANILISVGGNVCAVGDKFGEPWRVGVQNPDGESSESIIGSVNLSDNSMVTSGTYQRYYTVGGVRYHHIVDPATLMPSQLYAAVTVIHPDSGIADALSTALFCLSESDAESLLQQYEDAHALWVYSDNSTKSTQGFTELLRK